MNTTDVGGGDILKTSIEIDDFLLIFFDIRLTVIEYVR